MASTIHLINAIKSLADLPVEELKHFCSLFSPKKIKKGDFFLKAGGIPQYLGFIQSGVMRLYYLSESGMEFTKHFGIKGGFVLSFGAYLENRESRFYIEAIKDTNLLVADVKEHKKLIDRHPSWQIVGRKIAESHYLLKEKRESEFLLDDALTRYLNFLADYPNLESEIQQYYIASYLGITRESLSRIRLKIKKQNYHRSMSTAHQ